MPLFLAAYLHQIDPFAIKFPDGFFLAGIRWYGLSYIAGFIVGYLLACRVCRVGISSLKTQHVGDFVFAIVVGVVLGGRLGYVLFYQLDLLWSFSSAFPFWGVLEINRGGMASHGGMIGCILACVYFARRHGHAMPHLADLVSFAAPLGVFFGRIANFVNGELLGRECSSDLPWAVKFPQEMSEWDASRFYDLTRQFEGSPSAETIITQIQQGNQAVIEVVQPLLTYRHPSQIYAALLEGLLVFAVLALVWTKPRKPGVIGATFCITYGLVRIFGELFREPDAHIGFEWLNMTRGQWLSVVLVVAGLVLLAVFSRRNVQPMGGWRRTEQAAAQESNQTANG